MLFLVLAMIGTAAVFAATASATGSPPDQTVYTSKANPTSTHAGQALNVDNEDSTSGKLTWVKGDWQDGFTTISYVSWCMWATSAESQSVIGHGPLEIIDLPSTASWDESTLTWNNQPSLSGLTVVATMQSVGTWSSGSGFKCVTRTSSDSTQTQLQAFLKALEDPEGVAVRMSSGYTQNLAFESAAQAIAAGDGHGPYMDSGGS
jgi:hypothetical protein